MFALPKLVRMAAGVSAAGLLLSIMARGQQAESTVTVVEGSEPTLLHFGDSTEGAAISPGTDVDLFTFNGRQGETVRIAVQSTSVWWDPIVEILDPNLMPLPGGSCTGNCCGSCSFVVDSNLSTTGSYIVIVSDAGADEPGSYVLQIDRLPPFVPLVVECNSTVADAIQAGTDTDFFEFEGVTGAMLRINVQSTSVWWDPRVELFDPAGASISIADCTGDCCGTCSFSINTNLTSAGVYRLQVSDLGFDEAGGYQFTLQFLTGRCPTGPYFTPFCPGDGTGAACPCGSGQEGAPGTGCLNSFGTGGLLAATGMASVASDTVQLQSSGLPSTSTELFFQGTGARNAGLGVLRGDGLLCLGGTLTRLGVRPYSAGGNFGAGVAGDPAISVAGGLPAAGGTRYYQAWYRNAAPSFCTPSTFNLTNALRIVWRP